MVANFSDDVPPCFAQDVWPRSNMLACFRSCLFVFQSGHIQPGVAEILPIHAVFRSCYSRGRGSQLVLSNDFEQLESMPPNGHYLIQFKFVPATLLRLRSDQRPEALSTLSV